MILICVCLNHFFALFCTLVCRARSGRRPRLSCAFVAHLKKAHVHQVLLRLRADGQSNSAQLWPLICLGSRPGRGPRRGIQSENKLIRTKHSIGTKECDKFFCFRSAFSAHLFTFFVFVVFVQSNRKTRATTTSGGANTPKINPIGRAPDDDNKASSTASAPVGCSHVPVAKSSQQIK